MMDKTVPIKESLKEMGVDTARYDRLLEQDHLDSLLSSVGDVASATRCARTVETYLRIIEDGFRQADIISDIARYSGTVLKHLIEHHEMENNFSNVARIYALAAREVAECRNELQLGHSRFDELVEKHVGSASTLRRIVSCLRDVNKVDRFSTDFVMHILDTTEYSDLVVPGFSAEAEMNDKASLHRLAMLYHSVPSLPEYSDKVKVSIIHSCRRACTDILAYEQLFDFYRSTQFEDCMKRYSNNTAAAITLASGLLMSIAPPLARGFMELIEDCGDQLARKLGNAVYNCSEHASEEDVTALMSLLQDFDCPYTREKVAGPMFECGRKVDLYKIIDFAEEHKSDPAYLISVLNRVADIGSYANLFVPRQHKWLAEKYLQACDLLGLHDHQHFVLQELECYLNRESDFMRTIDDEKEFLRRQSSETMMPLAAILCHLKDHSGQIKQLNVTGRRNLAMAYSIAKDNKDKRRKNYLNDFYMNLWKCLDRYPDKVGEWAASIVSDFRTKTEGGLLRTAWQH